MPDTDFRCDLFTRLENYEEGPLCDRKVDLYGGFRSEQGKAKLIKDLIAIANTARRFKREGYLLCGIDDEGEIIGVEADLEAQRREGESNTELWGRLKHDVSEIVAGYVKPHLIEWDLRNGVCQEKQVAYFLIWPDARHPDAFRMAKKFPPRGALILDQEQSWIRVGESNRQIATESLANPQISEEYKFSYAEAPYPLPSDWIRYLRNLLSDPRLVRAQSIEPYLNLASTSGEDLERVLRDFLENEQRMQVLIGAAGSGKTAFVRRKVAELASSLLAEMESAWREESFHQPTQWVPVHFPLHSSGVLDATTMTRTLLDNINQLGSFWDVPKPFHPEYLFGYRSLNWLVWLDGLDEISTPDKQRQFLEALHVFLAAYPRVKVVMTTRPDAALADWSDWLLTRERSIDMLSDSQIGAYISASFEQFVPDEYQAYVEYLRSDPEIWTLCKYPLYLSQIGRELFASLTRSQESEIDTSNTFPPSDIYSPSLEAAPVTLMIPRPIEVTDFVPLETTKEQTPDRNDKQIDIHISIRLGIILDRVYGELWTREIRRGLVSPYNSDDWWSQIALLATETDGHKTRFGRKKAMSYFVSSEPLQHLLSLGILDASGRSDILTFRTMLTKAYFAATLLRSLIDTEDLDTARAHLARMTVPFRERLQTILVDLTNADISSIFQERSST